MRALIMVMALNAVAFMFSGFVSAADKGPAKLEGTLALSGYSPVEAVETGAGVRGEAKIASAYEGFIYNFPNAASKAKFDAAPEKYGVKLEGNCPVALLAGTKVKGNPSIFAINEKRLFLFKDAAAKAAFDKEPAKYAKQADAAAASAPMKKKKEGS